ncbi:MAG: gamma-glutamyl-gamma-aminobutyrate hydrolase family protein [Acidobacteriaceae bacterium]|jgi:putative glutamine amidotransferase|nr:gamma-glutamyl-gamma-aminobutyrate hydrolase family protein [Acidobacteriaceae bacterium]
MKRVLLTYTPQYAPRMQPYFDALRSVGLTPVEPGADAYDAVLLAGGNDIDPAHYGQSPDPRLGPLDPPRDVYELDIAWAALERDLPILAICRGMQLLNVACGGTLHQHIDGHRDVFHPVLAQPTSRLAHITGQSAFEVNSRHHQALDQLGDGLVVTAHSGEIIEAAEMPGRRFVLAVQWHPEDLVGSHAPHRALFAALADTLKA